MYNPILLINLGDAEFLLAATKPRSGNLNLPTPLFITLYSIPRLEVLVLVKYFLREKACNPSIDNKIPLFAFFTTDFNPTKDFWYDAKLIFLAGRKSNPTPAENILCANKCLETAATDKPIAALIC